MKFFCSQNFRKQLGGGNYTVDFFLNLKLSLCVYACINKKKSLDVFVCVYLANCYKDDDEKKKLMAKKINHFIILNILIIIIKLMMIINHFIYLQMWWFFFLIFVFCVNFIDFDTRWHKVPWFEFFFCTHKNYKTEKTNFSE